MDTRFESFVKSTNPVRRQEKYAGIVFEDPKEDYVLWLAFDHQRKSTQAVEGRFGDTLLLPSTWTWIRRGRTIAYLFDGIGDDVVTYQTRVYSVSSQSWFFAQGKHLLRQAITRSPIAELI